MADNESSSSNEDAAHSTSVREVPPSIWTKFTAKHLIRDCPYIVGLDVINTSLWDIPAPADADKTHAITWVAKMVHDYYVVIICDDELFDDFKVDFEDWTRDMFLKVERSTLKALKTVLWYKGIYTGNNRARVVDFIYKTRAMDNSPEWDPAEFKAMEFDHRLKAYKRQQNTQRTAPAAEQNTQRTAPAAEQNTQQTAPVPTIGVPSRPPELPHDPYKTLSPRCKKYTGDAYDLLDNKIKIFFSICWQVDIKEEEFYAVFPRILTGRAEMFYIQVVERDDSFASAYMAIKNHFDHDVHHQHYYTDWTTTSFARTRMENPEKGLYELCQRALGKNFKGEDALRTTVINACRGVPELEMALFKPALICEGLFLDLRSAIETHLARGFRGSRGGSRGRGGFSGGFRGGQAGTRGSQRFNSYDSRQCWLTNYTDEERKAALTIDMSTAGKASIKFGKGSVIASVGTAQVLMEIGKIDFEVLEAPTPFLLCLADMDRLDVYFNNTTDELVQGENRTPVIRKWGHLWFHLNKRERATMFLTETELRRLYCWFGHLAVMRLVKLLKNAGYNDFKERTLEEITKFCYYYVMYLGNRPVLHVVDASTAFQGARFLSAILAKETWQALRIAEFRAEVKIMGMAVKAVNDMAGLDGLVLTLLVFGAYPRMTTELPPSPLMVADALNTWNGPATEDVLALPLQSEVLVWRESDGWNGPYKVRSIDGHNVTVDMVNGPSTFRSIVVKPYYRLDYLWTDLDALHAPHAPPVDVTVPLVAQLRKRGRPLGLKNKSKAYAYMMKKEEADYELAIKLRNDGVITTLGAPFEATILAHLPLELALKYLEGTLLYVIKPLYGIAEAGVYWWITYHGHHRKELDMSISTDADAFGLVDFNGCMLTMENGEAILNIENIDRGLRYVPVDLINAKLIVFLGFVLMLVNELTNVENIFLIRGNMIHYSLTKCKRVTRSVLASEIYGMVNGFDIGIVIATTLRMITERLGIAPVPLVICTDSYSLYECLVKLGTTKEKRLMIDIMALRQSYERREITEIR
ncbi:hypothetical protein BU23DRAFT_581893 [Bimuria novae-zelandiae CBS 107.79]|uniref:Uncharacterized protein n=1 Tax=Bimuria novae-zelandiae CBS 107.79 TaxID=1447943 RepID=A0A6A5V1J4_9PLEO|nr:hypothetical protein BU23DRAFT_581893 [Bimuria novae-zelandiae CBS 107.79]